MQTLTKTLFMLGIGITVLTATDSAFAQNKVWNGFAPKVSITAEPENFYFQADVAFEIKKVNKNSTYLDSASFVMPGQYVTEYLSSLVVPEGGTLTYKKLTLTDSNNSPLPNCQLTDNPGILDDSAEINVTISADGCQIH